MTGLLSDTDIAAALDAGELTIDPLDRNRLQPASVDLTLGSEFRAFMAHDETHVDPEAATDVTRLITATVKRPFVLHPGEFALAATAETIGLGDTLAGRLEGRSSMGRLGLVVHSTAGFIDPGWSGQITLELTNLAPLPILLRPGLSCAQLCLVPLSSPVTRRYGDPTLGSKYQGQQGPVPSRCSRC